MTSAEVVKEFINTHLETGRGFYLKPVYEVYKRWCYASGYDYVGRSKFGWYIEGSGIPRSHRPDRARFNDYQLKKNIPQYPPVVPKVKQKYGPKAPPTPQQAERAAVRRERLKESLRSTMWEKLLLREAEKRGI